MVFSDYIVRGEEQEKPCPVWACFWFPHIRIMNLPSRIQMGSLDEQISIFLKFFAMKFQVYIIENVVFFPMHADVHLSKKAGFPK